MSGWIAHVEQHGHFRIKAFLRFEIFGGREGQPVRRRLQCLAVSQESRNAAIFVGDATADFNPSTFQRSAFQHYTYALRRQPLRRIQNMRADSTHTVSSFSKRKQVILFCSAAATRISSSGGFSRRDCRIASISSALLPVAHTMKM